MNNLSAIKTIVLDRLLQLLNENASFIESQIEQKSKDMSEAPGRMQSRYDSSKQEIGYMVDSLNNRLFNLKKDISIIEEFKREYIKSDIPCQNVGIGSFVQLEIGGEKEFYFILPAGGGTTVSAEELGEITIISPDSALTKAIIGRKVGEETQLNSAKIVLISAF